MHTGARARKQKYISICISLYMKTFLKTGVYIYMLFADWEVRGRNCVRGLEYRQRPLAEGGTQTEDTVSSNTDRPRLVNNIFSFFFFFFEILKSQENFPPNYNLCVLKCDAFVLMKGAIDCKPKQNITTRFLAR